MISGENSLASRLCNILKSIRSVVTILPQQTNNGRKPSFLSANKNRINSFEFVIFFQFIAWNQLQWPNIFSLQPFVSYFHFRLYFSIFSTDYVRLFFFIFLRTRRKYKGKPKQCCVRFCSSHCMMNTEIMISTDL